MQHPARERDSQRTRVSGSAAMRAREVSRPSEADLVTAENEADRLIGLRLSGRSPRPQGRGSGTVAERS